MEKFLSLGVQFQEEINAQIKDIKEQAEKLEERKQKLGTEIEEMSKKYPIEGPLIHLNVGGKNFTTLKKTISKYEGTFLEAMFSGRHTLLKDENGRYFIDRPSEPFKIILSWLQTEKLFVPVDKIKREELLLELDYFGLTEYAEDFLSIKMDSVILTDKTQVDQLSEWHKFKNTELLYRGTRDGFRSANFHSKCDNKGETLGIVKDTNGNIFGGFSSISWASNGNWKVDANAFIFSLKGPHNVKMFKIVGINNAVYHHPGYILMFGAGHDLYIADNCNVNNSSSSVNGSYGIGSSLSSSTNFQVSEIEVFRVFN